MLIISRRLHTYRSIFFTARKTEMDNLPEEKVDVADGAAWAEKSKQTRYE